MEKNKDILTAEDIVKLLNVSQSKSYSIIRDWNKELEAQGYYTLRGKVPRAFYETKIFNHENLRRKSESEKLLKQLEN